MDAYPIPEPQDCTLTRKGGESLPAGVSFGAASISFHSVPREAAGDYILVAENKAGKGSVTFTLEVQCKCACIYPRVNYRDMVCICII